MNKNTIPTVSFETTVNVLLEEINFDLWLQEMEEAAAYRDLVASYGSRR